MLTQKTVVQKTLKLISVIAVLCAVVGFMVAVAIDGGNRRLTQEARTTVTWLVNRAVASKDQKLLNILESLSKSFDRNNFIGIASGDHSEQRQGYVEDDSFKQANDKHSETSSNWEFQLDKDTLKTIAVNYGFGTLISNDKVNTAGDLQDNKSIADPIFARVSKALKTKGTGQISAKDYSDTLMEYLGIKDLCSESIPSLRVRWLYIACSDGTMSVFPATVTEFDSNFSLLTRPWYASIVGASPLVQDPEYIHAKDIGLTNTYADLLSGGSTRTFYQSVVNKKNGKTYYICVDLVVQPPDLSNQPDFVDHLFPVANTDQIGANYLIFRAIKISIYTFIGVMCIYFCFLLVFGRLILTFARFCMIGRLRKSEPSIPQDIVRPSKPYVVGRDKNRRIEIQAVQLAASEENISIGARFVLKMLEFSMFRTQKRAVTYNQITADSIPLTISDGGTLGWDIWSVIRTRSSTVGTCRLCSREVPYQDDDKIEIGKAIVEYRQNNIDVSFHESDETAENATGGHIDRTELEDKIKWNLLMPTANHDSILVPKSKIPLPISLSSLPQIQVIEDDFDLLRTGRVNVSNVPILSSELFEDKDINMLINSDFFTYFLSNGKGSIEFLNGGNVMDRVVIVKDEDEWSAIVSSHEDVMMSLIGDKKTIHYIVITNIEAAMQQFCNRVNFSVVHIEDRDAVLYYELDNDDFSGYISWRPVEVAFYKYIFDAVREKKKQRWPSRPN